MSELTNERLQQILADCEGVTPGLWSLSGDYEYEWCVESKCGVDVCAAFEAGYLDAKHLANCDPQTVRALVEELLKAREVLAILGHEVNWDGVMRIARERNEASAERDALRTEVERLRAFAHHVYTGFDCDVDAHKYGTWCRACAASRAGATRSWCARRLRLELGRTCADPDAADRHLVGGVANVQGASRKGWFAWREM